ncbi:hypothetical protein [Natrialba asiatica]|uniref:Uncharacterized protein n=1 Tax=Natrialba asiatica (strain ATCC 700177 / DSM 12278 / JCM 9576 / FERM P-10747 / NBRC 102637 / 172P1) TaxID=29540 RepID=M0AGX2_NATA1|nr:hypothetical protein [Natrialba asiatica]ELY97142.1 hypothetical protein C481_21176 [Natrialba asiatica DSM 12278]
MSDQSLSRREFIASGVAAVGAVLGTQSASADIWSDEGGSWAASHITHVGDDAAELEKYQPRLVTLPEDRQRMIGIYGWYADSDRYNTRAYNYWMKYSHQDSLTDRIPFLGSLFAEDAHLGDHEPFTALVDSETGAVQEVLYSGYHHYASVLAAENAHLSAEAVEGKETHTPLEVVTPHHHYRLAGTDDGVLASNTTSMESFLDAFPVWDDDGVWASTDRRTVADPWRVRDTGTWWDKSTLDYQFARIQLFLAWRDEHDNLVGV